MLSLSLPIFCVVIPSLRVVCCGVFDGWRTLIERDQQLRSENHPLPRQWQTWKHTPWKYKKVKIKCINSNYVTPCIPTEKCHTSPIGAEIPKEPEQKNANWTCQPKGKPMKLCCVLFSLTNGICLFFSVMHICVWNSGTNVFINSIFHEST